MEIVFGAVSGFLVEVSKCMFSPIKRHVSYFFNHDKKVQILNEKLKKLHFNGNRVQDSVSAATRNGHLIYPEVQNWLNDINKKIADEVEKLENDKEEAKKRCFMGFCPNFMSRYHLSKKADSEVTTIAELLREAEEFINKGVSHRPDPKQAVAEIVETAVKGFETFRSRQDVLQGILDALRDPDVQRVGVYGMGGVGKTMLVKEVAMKARKQNLFDAVAIATISNSKKTDIKNVQAQIAEALGTKLEEESEPGRAKELWQRLKNAKGVLIILDDVWVDDFKLEDIGILVEDDQKISTERHKLLFTSRNSELLSNLMKAEKNFEVKVLSLEEGMVLFAKIVGQKVEAPEYERIAADVVDRCEGLPVAISAIAKALKPLNLDGWKNASRQIKRSNLTNLAGIREGVYLSLELSYNHLRSVEARRIFLLCSLMPQGSDVHVSDLIKYSWGLGFLERVSTLDEARLHVSSLVDELKSSSLLLGSDDDGRSNDECVKVHDIVRDVSISIASKNKRMFVVDDEAHMEELLDKEKLKKCTALSLPYSDIEEVPVDMLESAELEMLLLFNKHESLRLPDAIIKENNKMKLLGLAGMNFPSLPSSFVFLTNLRTLCLKKCRLRDITIIGKLKRLEILSLVGSDIVRLPEELAQVSKLKLLDLRDCYRLKVIPANIISQLCRLEELYIGSSFDRWDEEGNASVAELKPLIRLIALDISILNVQKMPDNLFSEKLERYSIRIGEMGDWDIYSSRRILKLSGIHHLDHSIEMLLKKTENLYLGNFDLCDTNFATFICHSNLTRLVIKECNNMRNLFTSSMARSLVHLKCLEVRDCKSMIEIIAKDEEDIVDATKLKLPSLTDLKLYRLPELKSFSCKTIIEWPSLTTIEVKNCDRVKLLFANSKEVSYQRGQQGEEEKEAALFWANEVTFTNLTRLVITECNNMRNLFTSSMARSLVHLKCLEVHDCKSMIEIIARDEEEIVDATKLKLPSLTDLELYQLPELKSFSCKTIIEWPSLTTIEVKNCDRVKLLFANSKEVSYQRGQQGEEEREAALFWANEVTFTNLTGLVIKKCNNMRNLFIASMARSLVHLKRLEVCDCKSMIEIIARDEEEIVDATKLKLPSLIDLKLDRLPKLKSFSCKTIIEWPSLTTMKVEQCDGVKLLFANSEEVSYQRGQQREEEREAALFWANEVTFPCLESLILFWNGNLKEIWKGDLVLQCFPSLNYLNFVRCGLENLHIEHISLFSNLKKLEISFGSIKEIIQGEGSKLGLSSVLKLSQLKLSDLNKPRRLWDEKCEPFEPFFPELVTLEVSNCIRLEKLVPSSKSFPNLVILDISQCDGLINLLTHFVAKSFVQLTKMSVAYCTKIEAIIGEDEAQDNISFRQLKYLKLNNLPSLQNFCLTKCSFEFPSLDELIVVGCPQLKMFCHGTLSTPKLQNLQLGEGKEGKHCTVINDGDLNSAIQHSYQEKVVFSGLENWDFTKFPELVEILNSSSLQTTLVLKNLTKLEACNCKSTSLGYLFTPSMALCLVNLGYLKVQNCPFIEQVIAMEVEAATSNIIIPQLWHIYIIGCSNLISFCVGSYSFECPNLHTLMVNNCPKIVTFFKEQEKKSNDEGSEEYRSGEEIVEAFFSDKVDFSSLYILELTSINIQKIWQDGFTAMPWILRVISCDNLKHVMSSSIVPSFFRLSSLRIQDCKTIETVIVAKEESSGNLDFHVLRYLTLDGLPKFKSFCSILDSNISPLFDHKVSFPNLESIRITHLNNVKILWSNQIPTDSFCMLERLNVAYCENLLNIFSNKMLGAFKRLGELIITGCPSLEDVVHEVQELSIEETDAIEKTGPKEVHLIHLPKLKSVHVNRCWNLKALFPLSVARRLVGLEELYISFCGIEEVVSKEQGSQEINDLRFEFPALTTMKLQNLPKLRSFYPGMCTILDCSKLKILDSFHCNKLKMFAAKRQISHQKMDGKDTLEIQNMLLSPFSIEKVMSRLEELSLNSDDIEMIEDCQFRTRLFDEIKTLKVQCYHDDSQVFQFSFLRVFHNLEKLVVRCGKFKNLFRCIGVVKEENYGGALPRIKYLQLDDLDLRHIQNQNIEQNSPILENLETLDVWHCDTTFPSLAPHTASFLNLTNLDVWNCNGMEKVLDTSTCRNLVQLKKMRIRECYMVTEIVAKEARDEGICDITFGKLEYLELDCLPSLASFYSGNYTLRFPSLERVIVKQCPELKIFSKGAYTSGLEEVHDEVWEWNSKDHWAGDLNSTIQQLHAEKGGYRGLNYLDFSKFSELIDIWNRNQQETLDFKNLQSLQICNYNSSEYLFTPSMASVLKKLCTLKVQNCTTIEHILAEEGSDGSEQVNDGILFPLLESVLVESCLSLTSFFLLGMDTFECISLNEITVIGCPKMVTFASAFSREQKKDTTRESSKDDAHSESFFTDKVLLPSLVYLKLSSTNIRKIWKDSKLPTLPSCVQHLTELIVEDCGNLRYLWPSSLVKSCAQLETLEIRNCELMNGVIFTKDSEEERIESSGVEFEFPYLRRLVIENCPLDTFITTSLTRNERVTIISALWDEKVALHSLKTLQLKNIAAKAVWQRQYLTAQCLVQLRRISIIDCHMIKEIITCVADEVSRDGIVFNQLKYLELDCLPELESFCSRECTLEFPYLKEVFVKVCRNMKSFSGGETSTPKLHRLQLSEGEDEELCEGGLNTNIQKYFAKHGMDLVKATCSGIIN